jgi:thiol-disulfide isomerase/thioredoxin
MNLSIDLLTALPEILKYSDKDVQEVFVTSLTLSDLSYTSLPLNSYSLENILACVDNEFLRNTITTENDRIYTASNSVLQYPTHLIETEYLKDEENVDVLLKEILAQHKNKVVYMDFWGSWCGPCLAELDHAPKVKETLKGKDVVFIYMANGT